MCATQIWEMSNWTTGPPSRWHLTDHTWGKLYKYYKYYSSITWGRWETLLILSLLHLSDSALLKCWMYSIQNCQSNSWGLFWENTLKICFPIQICFGTILQNQLENRHIFFTIWKLWELFECVHLMMGSVQVGGRQCGSLWVTGGGGGGRPGGLRWVRQEGLGGATRWAACRPTADHQPHHQVRSAYKQTPKPKQTMDF